MTKTSLWLAAFTTCALGATSLTPLRATAAGTLPPVATTGADMTDTAPPKYGTWGFDASGEDPSVSPGTDFFRFADGTWWDKEVIPADKVRFGNFDKLNVLSEARTRLLIESAASGSSSD